MLVQSNVDAVAAEMVRRFCTPRRSAALQPAQAAPGSSTAAQQSSGSGKGNRSGGVDEFEATRWHSNPLGVLSETECASISTGREVFRYLLQRRVTPHK